MIFEKFHRPTINLVAGGSLYLMLILAFAMVFLPFQPVQQAEAGLPALIGLGIVLALCLLLEGDNPPPAEENSSSLPSVPEFIDVVKEEVFLS